MSPSLKALMADAWEEYGNRWRAYAGQLLRDGDAADAAVQEAIARTLSAGPSLTSTEEVHWYVRRAIKNTAYKRWKKSARTSELEDQVADHKPTPLQQVLKNESRQAISSLANRAVEQLANLPGEQRRAIELRFFHQPPMTLREIGETEGAPLTTIQSRISAGLRALADGLACS